MILLGLSASSAEFSKGDMERALTQLDREIEKRDSYVAVRQAYLCLLYTSDAADD